MKESAYVGIDLGGTSIKYAVVEDKNILWSDTKPTNASYSRDELIDNIHSCVTKIQSLDYAVKAVGIGTPGLVDVDSGFVKGGAYNLPDWEDLPLGDIMKKKTGLPVFVDNDANLMGLGEYSQRSELGKNVIFITIGTGIGGAIIINGELFRGSKFAGSELGCIPMEVNGVEGFWEDFASTSAMVKNYQKLIDNSSNEINGKYLMEKFEQGDADAMEIVENNTRLLGQGIGAYINIFNPDYIIIGGGISEAGGMYIDKIKSYAFNYAMDDCKEGVQISAAKLGNKAGFLGAVELAKLELEKL